MSQSKPVLVALLLGVVLGTHRQGWSDQTAPSHIAVKDKVQVRAGAGRTFYVVGELSRGTPVRVDEVIFGWYKIVPPPGVTSFVSKAFVDLRGDGTSGRVTVPRAAVKAASVLGPGESYRRQVDLLQGDQVRVVGEEDSFYRIVPPRGSYVYLPPASVQPIQPEPVQPKEPLNPNGRTWPDPAATADPQAATVGTTPAATPHTADGPESEPAGSPPQQPESNPAQRADAAPALGVVVERDSRSDTPPPTSSTAPPLPPSSPSPDGAHTPRSDLLKAVERKLDQVQGLPLEDQPIQAMLQAYGLLWENPDLPPMDRHIVAMRIKQLHRNAHLAQTLKRITTVQQAGHRSTPGSTPGSTPAGDRAGPRGGNNPPVGSAPTYNIIGRLLASSVYDGDRLPRLFRVVEPMTGRTLAYVQPAGVSRAADGLGRDVGIVGQPRFDPALKLDIVQAQRIDILNVQPPPTKNPAQ